MLVCPQELKGSLTPFEAAAAIAAGVRRALPDAEVVELPLSDGGPGTAAIVSAASDGELVEVEVTGPLGATVRAHFALLPPAAAGAAPVAVIEAASAAGLALVSAEARDAGRATTYGVGELVRAALDRGAHQLIVAVGGTASNDGGAGAAQALGYRLLDAAGAPLREPAGGLDLLEVVAIDHANVDRRLAEVDVRVAVDVTNALLGPEGATKVYGPQKGATGELAVELEAALDRWAGTVEADLGISITDLAGGGAGGGLAAGLIAAIGGRIESGAALVADAVRPRGCGARRGLRRDGRGPPRCADGVRQDGGAGDRAGGALPAAVPGGGGIRRGAASGDRRPRDAGGRRGRGGGGDGSRGRACRGGGGAVGASWQVGRGGRARPTRRRHGS